MRTREDHLAWSKERAHEYLARGDAKNAITSMMSDMQKHPDTKYGVEGILGALGLNAMMSGDPEAARRYIDGFN